MQVSKKLDIDPEIIGKLDPDKGLLWSAVHDDGSGNRINENAVLEASILDVGLGILTAASEWIKKKFRNRGKTRADFAAEKEAAGINKTAVALTVMLREYLQAAREGTLDREALDELIGTLEETQGYCRSGKLRIGGREELEVIRKSITDFTATLTGENPGQEAGPADAFSRIREQLLRQRKLV